MKVMIFAAGLGTRLKPYTETIPKALVPVGGVPMLELLLNHLKHNGFSRIIINVHHFADQVVDFLERNHNFGLNITISHEEDLLLDTGGGLKKAAWFFDDQQPFLVQNVDVMSDIDYQEMLRFHTQTQSLATLAVSERETSRYFLFDDTMQLSGWENVKTGEVKTIRESLQNLKPFAFSGIHIIDPRIFGLMADAGKFSIVDTYLQLGNRQKISGFKHDVSNWADMGKPEDLRKAQHILEKLKGTNQNTP